MCVGTLPCLLDNRQVAYLSWGFLAKPRLWQVGHLALAVEGLPELSVGFWSLIAHSCGGLAAPIDTTFWLEWVITKGVTYCPDLCSPDPSLNVVISLVNLGSHFFLFGREGTAPVHVVRSEGGLGLVLTWAKLWLSLSFWLVLADMTFLPIEVARLGSDLC